MLPCYPTCAPIVSSLQPFPSTKLHVWARQYSFSTLFDATRKSNSKLHVSSLRHEPLIVHWECKGKGKGCQIHPTHQSISRRSAKNLAVASASVSSRWHTCDTYVKRRAARQQAAKQRAQCLRHQPLFLEASPILQEIMRKLLIRVTRYSQNNTRRQ